MTGATETPEAYKMSTTTHKLQLKDIVWRNVIIFVYLHLSSLYAIYLLATGQVMLKTWYLAYAYAWCGAFGVTIGSHRLWSHVAFKANLPMRICLMLLNSIAFQNSIWEWSRDHRVHHKCTDTNADPHNYARGFFFAHMGWLLVKKHPDVIAKGATISMADLEADPVVMFQKKYYLSLVLLMSIAVPVFGISALMGESLWHCWNVCGLLRYVVSLHQAWLINSAAHSWGDKPFDKAIRPVDNWLIATFTHGEGWHNYHHVFPWDYKAGELGNYQTNYSCGIIDFCAKYGWAYDLKSVSAEMIQKRALRTGDSSWDKGTVEPLKVDLANEKIDYNSMVWGWNDKTMSEEDRKCVNITNKSI